MRQRLKQYRRPHELVHESGRIKCLTCKNEWATGPQTLCVGIPVYPGRWEDVWIDGFMTKSQLDQAGYQTGKTLPKPAALLNWSKAPDGTGYLRLYDPSECTPKRKLTEAQAKALEKAHAVLHQKWHCSDCGRRLSTYGEGRCHRCDAAAWAREMLGKPNAVILDSETTGLDGDAEIIELAIIDMAGMVLFNRRIKPHRPDAMLRRAGWRDICASDIHGIRPEDLEDAPTFAELADQIASALDNRFVIIYNAEFDLPLLKAMYRQDGLPVPDIDDYDCAMLAYSQYIGEWSRKYGWYRYQALPAATHSALEDCQATLELIKDMAGVAVREK